MAEITFSMVKPDATAAGHAGKIIDRYLSEGLEIVAARRLTLSRAQAEAFYAVHAERPFYGELVEFMTEGPIWAMALRGEGAVKRVRTIMGATNPAEADEGTLRKLFGEHIGRNAVHGSDSVENGIIESNFFFSMLER